MTPVQAPAHDGASLRALFVRTANHDRDARDELFEIALQQLRQRAHALRSHERPEHTLLTDELVHLAYVHSKPSQQFLEFTDLSDFVRWHARVMKNLLVSHARHRLVRAEVSDHEDRVSVALDAMVDGFQDKVRWSLIDLDAAMETLKTTRPDRARLLDLYFFAGLNHRMIAEQLDSSETTVRRHLKETLRHLEDCLDDTE